MYALGRVFNALTSATTAKVKASLRNCGGVSIFCIGATSGDVTLFSYDAAGNETAFIAVEQYWTQAGGVWTKHSNNGAAVTAITCVTGGLLCVEVDAQSLPAGAVTLAASHASGSFVIVQRDLHLMKTPENLADARVG
jgi:hypothetical protein